MRHKRIALDFRSENAGGLISMGGSLLFIIGGDTNGIFVAAMFAVAELVMFFVGHLRGGYSLGCFLLCLGDVFAASSTLVKENIYIKIILYTMATSWLLGASRALLHALARRLKLDKIQCLADQTQQLTSVSVIFLRIPLFIAAVLSSNIVACIVFLCWMISDVLIGRLHKSVILQVRSFGIPKL